MGGGVNAVSDLGRKGKGTAGPGGHLDGGERRMLSLATCRELGKSTEPLA
jgi:hypothetical protein